MLDILKECEKRLDHAIEIRRALHLNPELSEHETATLCRIRDELSELNIPFDEILMGGILAYIGQGEKTVLIRADCDALPMQESEHNAKAPKACVSEVPGVAHTCGHDSHTAMLLTAAGILKEHEACLKGRVLLLFERAEETGTCVGNVLRFIDANHIHIDSCMANHVTADLPVGQVSIPAGISNAGSFCFDITLKGKGGHGSTPSKVNNPIDCFLSIAQEAKDIRMRYCSPFEPATVHICSVNTGGAFNITPEVLRFSGSLRYFHPETGKKLSEELEKIIAHTAAIYDDEVVWNEYREMYSPVYNDPQEADHLTRFIAEKLGAENIISRKPAMGSESFGAFTQRYPGVKCSIGIRNEEEGIVYPTHSPYFDMDERGIQYGAYLYVAYALSSLNMKSLPN